MKVQIIGQFRLFINVCSAILLTLLSTSTISSQNFGNIKSNDIQQFIIKGNQSESLFPDSALYYYQKGLQLFGNETLKYGQSIIKVDIFSRIGRIFHQQFKYSFALDYYNKALSLSQSISHDSLSAENYFCIAEINLENGGYADAVKFYLKSKNLFQKINLTEGIYWCDIGLGIVYRELGNTELSKKHYELAKQIGEQKKKEDLVAISYNNLGNLYKQIGEYGTALGYLQKALKSFEYYGEERFISDCLDSIGEVYSEIGNYERAIEYFTKSTEIAEILGDKYRLLSRYANIAQVYAKFGANENALMYFSKTTELAQSIGDKSRLSEILIMLSDFYRHNNDLKNALKILNRSLMVSKEIGDTVSIANGYNSLSELSFLKGQNNSAYEYALKAFQISSKKDLNKTLLKSSLNLSKILEIHGNHKDALYYYKIHKRTKDNLLDSEKFKILEETEVKYNVERVEREKLELENMALVRDENIQRRNILIAALGLFIIILFAMALWYYFKKRAEKIERSEKSLKMYRKIDLLNSQLSEKNRELTSKALLISQNNEILKVAVKSIEDYLDRKDGNRNDLKKLKKQLQEIYEEKSWDDFLHHYEQVHPSFYKKLNEHFGDLTSAEQKLCAFLKMNLNTKEISQINNQSPKAVEVMRSRIRKKLGIAHSESLTKKIQLI